MSGQYALRARQFGHREVEQLDADAGLADVDADEASPVRRDADQGARAAAVRAEAARLLDQPVGHQLRDDVADGPRTQARRRAQREPAHRPVEIQPLQNGAAALPPQVTDRAPAVPGHQAPFFPAPARPSNVRGTLTSLSLGV